MNIMLVILKTADGHHDVHEAKQTIAASTMMTMNSKILYNVLFNHPKLKQFWNSLIQKGLLDFDPTTDRFKTTAKGCGFLKACNVLDYDVIYAKTTTSSLRRPLATMEHLM